MGERATVQRCSVESGKSDIAPGVLFGAALVDRQRRTAGDQHDLHFSPAGLVG
jgi:hypothetical protein